MRINVCLPTDDDVADHFLVDFEKKVIDEIEKRKHQEKEKEYEMGETDVPGPVDPDEEW